MGKKKKVERRAKVDINTKPAARPYLTTQLPINR